MNQKRTGQGADYILTNEGNVACNAAGDAVRINYLKARHASRQLQLGWAGAYVAGLFREYPWLESLKIELKVSDEYDDNGGTYRSTRTVVGKVVPRHGVPSPAQAIVDGQFDPDIGAELVEPYFDDGTADLYDSLRPDSADNNDITLNVNRQSVAELLECDEVSGKDAFVRLFPAFAEADGQTDERAAVQLPEVETELALGPALPVKSRVKTIELDRQEGVRAFWRATTFAGASHVLSGWAESAPAHGGYDKVACTITWQNGVRYQYRLDLQHSSRGAVPDVAADVLHAVELALGNRLNPRWTAKQHECVLARYEARGIVELARTLNATCMLSDV